MTGGWMDAGDMIHFSQTTGFSTALLEAAARLDPGNRAAIQEEADVGVRWLLKAHPFPDLFVTQVAGAVDHDRASVIRRATTRHRRLGDRHPAGVPLGTGVGGDIGGKVAAALALSADRAASRARAQLVAAAEQWYAAGKAAGRATPEVPGTGGFYRVDTFEDSLAAGAAALFRVTGERRLSAGRAALHARHGPDPARLRQLRAARRRRHLRTAGGAGAGRRPRPATKRAGSWTKSPRSRRSAPRQRLRACELLHLGIDRDQQRRRSLCGDVRGLVARSRRRRARLSARSQPVGRELRQRLRT